MSRKLLAVMTMACVLGVLSLMGACAPATPQIIEKEVIKTVVVEKEVPVEKKVVETVVVEKVVTVTPEPAKGPRVGGTYRILAPNIIRSLDPPAADGWEDWYSVGWLLYNQLYQFDDEGKLYAALAADMPKISTDGKVYTVPLRQGVKFHNGREMVADDVKFTIERQLWPEVYSWAKNYCANIVGYQDVIDGKTKDLAGVKVVDKYTIEITLEKPQATFMLAVLGNQALSIVPKQEVLDAGADWGSKVVIGTGPFKFVSWEPGVKAIYERNPDYWKPGLPYLQRIEFYENVDPSIQLLRWENGEAEYAFAYPASELPRLLSDPKTKPLLRIQPTYIIRRFLINANVKPFDDVRVRQAIAMALDKDGLERKKAGSVVKLEGYYAIGIPQYDPNFKSKWQYNPEAAKKLLAEAGFPNGFKTKLFASQDFKDVADFVQADLAKIGVEAELFQGETPEYRPRLRSGEIPLFLQGWGGAFPDASEFVGPLATCRARTEGYNDPQYCNPKVDELYEKAEQLPLLSPERTALYREIEDIIINQDVAWVGLWVNNQIGLGVSYVHNDKIDPISAWPRLETAWMEEKK